MLNILIYSYLGNNTQSFHSDVQSKRTEGESGEAASEQDTVSALGISRAVSSYH